MLHVRGRVLADAPDAAAGHVEVRDELWVVDGRVTWTRPARLRADAVEVSGWVLPGLVDAHCHVGLGPDGAVDRDTARAQAQADRDAGALLLRDAGSPVDTRWVDAEEDLPRVVRAGRHVARTRRYLRGVAHEVEPDQLPDAVRAQARAGDGWVKLVGDWIDRERGDLAPCWPLAQLRAAVAAAHEEGARVAVHTFSEEALPDLLAAGVDCLEHGTGLDEATVATAAARGTAVTPTLVNVETFPAIAAQGEAKFPRYAAHMRALHARRRATAAMAAEAGVRLLVGTDAGTRLPHGMVAAEVAALAGAGVGPLRALDAAAWGARRYLGHPVLEEGAPADLVVLDADPREDVAALAHPRAVVLRGRVVGGRVAGPVR
ncbi:Imidazolonepropionase [Quadrisphaera sp. DSM 44207]|nr:Imidazolonepropionase [Quadrisphaera sp. DSM 44207]